MTPRLETGPASDQHVIYKIGGSLLFRPESPRLDRRQIEQLLQFLKEQWNSGQKVFVVVGGGELARIREKDARRIGIKEPKHLDAIGIGVSTSNARILSLAMEEQHISSVLIAGEQQRFPKNRMLFRGGTTSGHTTDYVAVEAAANLGSPFVFMLSNIDGYLRKTARGKLTKDVIPEVLLSEYLKTAPFHSPGIHTPLDRPAAELALHSGITVVLLGNNLANVRACLYGDEFVGTIFHPR